MTGGLFITLEGIEGSGKTSQLPAIEAFLRRHGIDCVLTREPGGTMIGRKVRAILLDPDNHDLAPGAELMLYLADRVQHIHQVIVPNLDAGRVVVCDRYFDATLVYQGMVRDQGVDLIGNLHRLVCDDLKPDLTLLFDLTPETGLERAWGQIESGKRDHSESRFEKESLAFHHAVRNGYLDLAAKEPARFRIVDAECSIAAVRSQIEDLLLTFIKNIDLA